jgi:hypothetical protein
LKCGRTNDGFQYWAIENRRNWSRIGKVSNGEDRSIFVLSANDCNCAALEPQSRQNHMGTLYGRYREMIMFPRTPASSQSELNSMVFGLEFRRPLPAQTHHTGNQIV